MDNMVRFGVSIEDDLLDRFSGYMIRKGYTNRSEALRDLIRDTLNREEWEGGEAESIGTVSMIYSHESREMTQRLTKAQHDQMSNIVASLHVHVDRHNCLEVLVLRGRGRDLQKLGDSILSTRGVKHGSTSFTTLTTIS
jgi:CopG family nickel-responsive transcriptional regulator